MVEKKEIKLEDGVCVGEVDGKTINYKFGKYVGEVDYRGVPHGLGKFILGFQCTLNNFYVYEVFEGEFVGDEYEYGTSSEMKRENVRVYFHSGAALAYIGESTKEGARHGKGKSIKAEVESLDGNDVVNYEVSEGEFNKGKHHGKGKRVWSNAKGGGKYEGDFRNGEYHGQGQLTLRVRDGSYESVYEDDWVAGKEHGTGKHTTTSVDKWNQYEGKFRNGERHGKGMLILECGTTYEGEFENDEKHGEGITTLPDGQAIPVKSKNGKLCDEGERYGISILVSPDGGFEEIELRKGGLFRKEKIASKIWSAEMTAKRKEMLAEKQRMIKGHVSRSRTKMERLRLNGAELKIFDPKEMLRLRDPDKPEWKFFDPEKMTIFQASKAGIKVLDTDVMENLKKIILEETSKLMESIGGMKTSQANEIIDAIIPVKIHIANKTGLDFELVTMAYEKYVPFDLQIHYINERAQRVEKGKEAVRRGNVELENLEPKEYENLKKKIIEHTGLEQKFKKMTPGARLRDIVSVQKEIQSETGLDSGLVAAAYKKYAPKSVQSDAAFK